MLSDYAQHLLRSTCCHTVQLPNGFIGIYNGFSYWGRVEDGKGNLVAYLTTDYNTEENYLPNFTKGDFDKWVITQS